MNNICFYISYKYIAGLFKLRIQSILGFVLYAIVLSTSPIQAAVELGDLDSSTHGHSKVSTLKLALSERTRNNNQLFDRSISNEIGIDHANILTPNQFHPPFWNGRGIGAGDIDRDGYVDLAFASKLGVRVFKNQHGESFSELTLDIPELDSKDVFIAALVDWNDDGWLDLFITSYQDGNYWVHNNQGTFDKTLIPLPTIEAPLTKALSFGDIDQDGDIDAALGNWLWGTYRDNPDSKADNSILVNPVKNDTSEYELKKIPGIPGETLSILFSDFSGDGIPDLIVGNDFAPPDHFYTGNGDGSLSLITRQDDVIPISTNTTMSVDTADFDNDMDLDIYLTQIAAAATGDSARVPSADWDNYCDDITNQLVQSDCKESVRQRFLFGFGAKHEPKLIEQCKTIDDIQQRKSCASQMLLMTATRNKKPSLCDRIPVDQTKFICHLFFDPIYKTTPSEKKASIPNKKNENALLVSENGQYFNDRAADMKVGITGWSWNSKFADLDNDQWQDIFVVNGTWIRSVGTPSKFYFKNEEGLGFSQQTEESGLQSFMLQTAFVEVDIDNDGDLDIVANSTSGPIWFYRNNESTNNSIQFQFEDEIGNYYGIGNKLYLQYGSDGKEKQMRELKSGGGFLSFSPPLMHFGLKDVETVDRIRVQWSTGEESMIDGPFQAGNRYTVRRQSL